MALSKAPCLSLEASGSVAGALAFSRQKRQNIVKGVAVPSKQPSTAQLSQRSLMADATEAWHAVQSSPDILSYWRGVHASQAPRLPFYHFMIQSFMAILSSGVTPIWAVLSSLPPHRVVAWYQSLLSGAPVTPTVDYELWWAPSGDPVTFLETFSPSDIYSVSQSLSAFQGSFDFLLKDTSGSPASSVTAITLDAALANSLGVSSPDLEQFQGLYQNIYDNWSKQRWQRIGSTEACWYTAFPQYYSRIGEPIFDYAPPLFSRDVSWGYTGLYSSDPEGLRLYALRNP